MVLTDYLIIVNPTSGRGSKTSLTSYAADELSKHASVAVVQTQYRGHGKELAKEAVLAGIPNIIAVGGDGTVNEIAGVVAGTSSTLGILPMGSGNGLARELGLPVHHLRQCVAIITSGHTRQVDYGTVNDMPFFCTCGSGYDSEVAAGFADNKVRGLGPYIRLCVKSFFHLKPRPFHAVIDGKAYDFRTVELNCANIKQFGFGAEIAPLSDLADGTLNLTVLPAMNLWRALRFGIALFSKRLHRMPGVTTLPFRQMELRLPDDATFHVDGDAIEASRELRIKCIAGGLRVFAPHFA